MIWEGNINSYWLGSVSDEAINPLCNWKTSVILLIWWHIYQAKYQLNVFVSGRSLICAKLMSQFTKLYSESIILLREISLRILCNRINVTFQMHIHYYCQNVFAFWFAEMEQKISDKDIGFKENTISSKALKKKNYKNL